MWVGRRAARRTLGGLAASDWQHSLYGKWLPMGHRQPLEKLLGHTFCHTLVQTQVYVTYNGLLIASL